MPRRMSAASAHGSAGLGWLAGFCPLGAGLCAGPAGLLFAAQHHASSSPPHSAVSTSAASNQVGDFGLARAAKGAVSVGTFGTVSHMSPGGAGAEERPLLCCVEQTREGFRLDDITYIAQAWGRLQSAPPAPSPRAAELMADGLLSKAADVWSFGVICWEMYRSVCGVLHDSWGTVPVQCSSICRCRLKPVPPRAPFITPHRIASPICSCPAAACAPLWACACPTSSTWSRLASTSSRCLPACPRDTRWVDGAAGGQAGRDGVAACSRELLCILHALSALVLVASSPRTVRSVHASAALTT